MKLSGDQTDTSYGNHAHAEDESTSLFACTTVLSVTITAVCVIVVSRPLLPGSCVNATRNIDIHYDYDIHTISFELSVSIRSKTLGVTRVTRFAVKIYYH